MAGLAYVDASAFLKLPFGEAERDALESELQRWDGLVASALLRVEAARAALQKPEAYVGYVRAALEPVSMVAVDAAVVERAAVVGPPLLRALDAIHLATALSLGDDLGVFVAYDQRLLEAARAAGLHAVAPT